MNRTLHITLNRRPRTLTVDVRQSLLEVLRENRGLIGVKQGCGAGECGACTVLIDDEPVDACLFLAVWADGRSVRTVEGECTEGRLSPVQQAYLTEGAVQCGFCTPGLIMTSTAFVEKNHDRNVSRDQIRHEHAGNICRCTGYHRIVNAVQQCLDPEET
jgi:aerobic-type carbon monoxide dehydrogenase small subunit (CoxS/CutS family)